MAFGYQTMLDANWTVVHLHLMFYLLSLRLLRNACQSSLTQAFVVVSMSFKALASGADLVAIGRPIIWGLNLGGADGVTSVVEHLNHELTITMQLAGAKDIESVKTTELL